MKVDFWDKVLIECFDISFYSTQIAVFYLAMRELKKDWVDLNSIVMIFVFSILIPILAYAFIGEPVHLSMIICCLVLGFSLKPKN